VALLVEDAAVPPHRPPPQPAPILEVHVKAKAALDALVAAIGAEGRAAQQQRGAEHRVSI
jgi:hypothetical protein